MKILVIDDSPMQQKIAKIYLEKGEGYELITADNGSDGIEKAGAENPDLILLDVEMPGMNGDEVLRILKSKVKTKHIPVIMCTSLSERDVAARLGGMQIAGYLQKPHGFATLKTKIKEYIENNEALRAKEAECHEGPVDR